MSQEPTVAARDLEVGQHVAGRGPVRRVTEVSGMVEVAYEDGFPLLYPPDHPMLVMAPPEAESGPDTVAARDLCPGMYVLLPDTVHVHRVLFAYPYLSRGVEYVAVTLLQPGGGAPEGVAYLADKPLTVATPAQIAEAEAEGQRLELTYALEQLVRDIRQQLLPLAECAKRMVALLPVEAGLGYSRTTDPEAEPTASCPAGVACSGRDGRPSPEDACPACGHCSIHGEAGCAARTDEGRCGCTGGGA